MNLNSDETISQQTNHLAQNNLLDQQWHPCTRGFTIEQFFLMGQNGPFLRPLCKFWQDLDSPRLDIVERIKQFYPFSEEGQLLSKGLMILVNSQEQTIWKLIQEAIHYKPDQPMKSFRTFEAFASQLNLFSMIKSELIQIERKRCGGKHLHFHQVYRAVWQSHLDLFDQGRKFCTKQSLHLCIGDLIWGDSYRVPLQMLKYSFQGYLMQENKRFETLPKYPLPNPSNNGQSFTSTEPYNSQSKFQRFENDIKRRDACIPSQNNLHQSILQPEGNENFSPPVTIRTSSPEAMAEDIIENGEENVVETSPIKWRTRLWTLTLTTPHRTYSIEISPKGTTAISQTDGRVFPLLPMRTLSKEINTVQVGKGQTIQSETRYERTQDIIQQILAQLPEIDCILPYGTVTEIGQQSGGAQSIQPSDLSTNHQELGIGEGPFHCISTVLS